MKFKLLMKRVCLVISLATMTQSDGLKSQITLLKDYSNKTSPRIGIHQGVTFRESGFSGMTSIPNTNGREFWIVSDRGVNIDCDVANPTACRPTYNKMYPFPAYAPKIHRVRVMGDSVQILQTIAIKNPSGATVTGIINPTGFGSTALEQASTDTVQNCANFSKKIAVKDIWGIDSEGILVDAEGNFWICEEGGPTIWKVASNGVVIRRYTPYAGLPGSQVQDFPIDTCFKYRKNNRGFESITQTPNGRIYALIQSPLLYPTSTVGEGTRIHRMIEINPITNEYRMFAYLNDGIIGAAGSNQIRLRDWKLGDMAAINDTAFLVIEAAARGTSDIRRIYQINLNGATVVNSGYSYGGKTLEGLVDSAGLAANGVVPVRKTLFMDLLANSWPAVYDKAEGLTILNDSTIALCNDNDYGQFSANLDGVITPTTTTGHILVYGLKGKNKLVGYKPAVVSDFQGITGNSTSQSPYLSSTYNGVRFTSILSAGESINGYKLSGIPDGTGAFDNGNGTFTLLVNHEFSNTVGITRAHGSIGSFVSRWIINKSDLSVVSGSDLIRNVNLYSAGTYTTFSASNPSTKAAFSRFCSGDLPQTSAFYNVESGLGTTERIYMNGEETGPEGRVFGHIVSGLNAGTSYELPLLGKYSCENALANPFSQNKTIVAGTDDATPGQVYVYVGTKSLVGKEVDKAGLTNGKLYCVAVSGLT
ncbi:MAG: putative phytase, partial [Bacteroidota bacterium]